MYLLISSLANSQMDTLRIKNPSFEGPITIGGSSEFSLQRLINWHDCGKINFPKETPPDIHPNGFWGNNFPAFDGETYLGMVVRDNDTYEAVSTNLDAPLKGGKCYKFSIYLARSEEYLSRSRVTNEQANYTIPAILEIWGGSSYCKETEFLGETIPVKNTNWKIYTFELSPKKTHTTITLAANYVDLTDWPYCGHILLDGASDVIEIPCNK